MTYRSRPLILAPIATIVLVIALSKETWATPAEVSPASEPASSR
jgi:hypothetical protein